MGSSESCPKKNPPVGPVYSKDELIELWRKGASYAEITKSARELFKDDYTKSYTSVPLVRMRGSLNSTNLVLIKNFILEHCKSRQVGEWFGVFLQHYVDCTRVYTHTSFTLRTENNGVHVKTTIFLAELVIVNINEEKSYDSMIIETPDADSTDVVYFSCVAIEYHVKDSRQIGMTNAEHLTSKHRILVQSEHDE
jgi:hypothetical protein